MFKNFLALWKGKDFLNQILEDFNLMGKDTEEMFSSVLKKLLEGKEEPGLKDKVYSIDKKVNKLERKIRKRIVELMGDLPRIELFAREKTAGWDVWGNEVESDIEL